MTSQIKFILLMSPYCLEKILASNNWEYKQAHITSKRIKLEAINIMQIFPTYLIWIKCPLQNRSMRHFCQPLYFCYLVVIALTLNFIEKATVAQVFSCEFCEISNNTSFHRTPLLAASDMTILGMSTEASPIVGRNLYVSSVGCRLSLQVLMKFLFICLRILRIQLPSVCITRIRDKQIFDTLPGIHSSKINLLTQKVIHMNVSC